MPEPTHSFDSDTDPHLDAAIARYPLAPLPDGFIERAMARIEAEAPVQRAAMASPTSAPVVHDHESSYWERRLLAGKGPGTIERPGRLEAGAPSENFCGVVLVAEPARPPASSAAAAPAIRFRLQFLDLVLPALFAGMACMGLVMVLWSMDRVNPLWAAATELDLRLAWQTALLYLPLAASSVLLLACGLVAAMGLGALMLMVLDQPFAAAASTRPAPTSPSIARTSPTQ